MLVNDALGYVGIGRYHILYYGITILFLNVCCQHLYLNIFLLQDTGHVCKLPPGGRWQDFIPPKFSDGGVFVNTSCQMYNYSVLTDGSYNVDKTQLIACPDGYVFGEYGSTMYQDINMVCNDMLANVFPSLAAIAVWPTQPLFVPFMDRIGRKSVMVMFMLISGVLVLITPMATTFWTAYTLRCVARILSQACYLALTRHIVESHAVNDRIGSTTLIVSGYASGLPTLAIMQWLLDSNSRKLDFATGSLSLICVPLMLQFFHESPLFWVVNAKRERQSEKILRRMADLNRIELPGDFHIEPAPLFNIAIERKRSEWMPLMVRSWFKIMGNPYIFGRWFYVAMTWFTVNLVWVGASVTKTLDPLDFNWNYGLIGVAAMTGGLMTTYVMRILRKMEIVSLYLLLISVAFFLDAAIGPFDGKRLFMRSYDYARGFFYAVSAGLALPAMAVLRLQSSEIRGEECQPGAIFWMLWFGTIGGAIGMFYVAFMRMAGNYYAWVPFSFGAMAIIQIVVNSICFARYDYVEDLRWREPIKNFLVRKKRVTPQPSSQKRKSSVIEDPILGCSLLNNTC